MTDARSTTRTPSRTRDGACARPDIADIADIAV